MPLLTSFSCKLEDSKPLQIPSQPTVVMLRGHGMAAAGGDILVQVSTLFVCTYVCTHNVCSRGLVVEDSTGASFAPD